MRFGILLPQTGPWHVLLDRCLEVERLGYESLWVGDHHFLEPLPQFELFEAMATSCPPEWWDLSPEVSSRICWKRSEASTNTIFLRVVWPVPPPSGGQWPLLDCRRGGLDMALFRWPSWVGVVAGDLAGQRRYYRDVLGLREVEAGDGWIGFDLDGNLFELLAVSERPQYERPRYQVGFEVEDIETARAELIRRGVEPISEIEGSEATSRWAYFRDPEGNVFEITQRPTPKPR